MPTSQSYARRCLAAAALGMIAATPAFAHHPTGGLTPATFADGLLSGLGHPVIGLDHLAALIGVGLVAARFTSRGALALPGIWLLAMVGGVGTHLSGLALPFAEGWVSVGVVAVGVAAALRPTLPVVLASLIFAGSGLAHGYALGESVVGAEGTPVVGYLLGLALVQGAITTGIAALTRPVWARGSAAGVSVPSGALRFAGLALAVTGLAALTTGLPSLA